METPVPQPFNDALVDPVLHDRRPAQHPEVASVGFADHGVLIRRSPLDDPVIIGEWPEERDRDLRGALDGIGLTVSREAVHDWIFPSGWSV
jgi:hypothetical protein